VFRDPYPVKTRAGLLSTKVYPHPRCDGNCPETVEQIGVAGGVEWQDARTAAERRKLRVESKTCIPPPPVFCAKSVELIEKKGDSFLRVCKECGTVSKQKR